MVVLLAFLETNGMFYDLLASLVGGMFWVLLGFVSRLL